MNDIVENIIYLARILYMNRKSIMKMTKLNLFLLSYVYKSMFSILSGHSHTKSLPKDKEDNNLSTSSLEKASFEALDNFNKALGDIDINILMLSNEFNEWKKSCQDSDLQRKIRKHDKELEKVMESVIDIETHILSRYADLIEEINDNKNTKRSDLSKELRLFHKEISNATKLIKKISDASSQVSKDALKFYYDHANTHKSVKENHRNINRKARAIKSKFYSAVEKFDSSKKEYEELLEKFDKIYKKHKDFSFDTKNLILEKIKHELVLELSIYVKGMNAGNVRKNKDAMNSQMNHFYEPNDLKANQVKLFIETYVDLIKENDKKKIFHKMSKEDLYFYQDIISKVDIFTNIFSDKIKLIDELMNEYKKESLVSSSKSRGR